MANQETFADYDAILNMASVFGTSHDTLQAIQTTLEGIVAAINSNFFTGLVGAGATAYLMNIISKLKPLAQTCQEFNSDLRSAVANMRDGDTSGSNRFV